MLEATKIF